MLALYPIISTLVSGSNGRVNTLHTFAFSTDELHDWIQAEVVFPGTLSRGSRGTPVKRIQEWLTIHGFTLSIDADFGPTTQRQVGRFQSEQMGVESTGVVDAETFDALVAPMVEVLRRRDVEVLTLGEAAADYAGAHLEQHPVEVGGANRGPWVRLYMRGSDGADWLWCAGFVTFVLEQAAQTNGLDMPVPGSFSCDTLAAQGSSAGAFFSGADVDRADITPGSIFLVRKSATDWTHVGLVTWAEDEVFDTIEGNTNDEGSREGYEVCGRTRNYADKDFILIA